MDGTNGPLGESFFWGLPVAFAIEEGTRDRISAMSDEERDMLRRRSSEINSDAEMDELVRMVAEGKFE